MAEVTPADRKQARLYVDQAVLALNTSATLLVCARGGVPAEYQEMITAVRDDITRMIGDIGAIKASTL